MTWLFRGRDVGLRVPQVALSEETTEPTLTAAELSVLLASAALLRASRPAVESTREEIEPYLDAALRSPQCWSLQTQALRLRARYETDQKRRRHRSLMQLQSLTDDINPLLAGAETVLGRHLGLPPLTEEAASDPSIPEAPALRQLAKGRLDLFWSA